MKKGQYLFMPRGRKYRIYQADGVDSNGVMTSASPTDMSYSSKQEAYDKVRELNGWNNAKNNTIPVPTGGN